MSYQNTELFKKLQKATPFSTSELELLIRTAPTRYKDHFIEKRNNRGKRTISQPTRELKFLQWTLIEILSQLLIVHPAATAYTKGKSIKDHASPHAKNRYLLKLDFRNFFPSIDSITLTHCLKKAGISNDGEIEICLAILCRHDKNTRSKRGPLRLSIGAPSSPKISNFVMHEFDEILSEFCERKDIKYTRYADDIALSCSTPKLLDEAHLFVKKTLRNLNYLNLFLNGKKTVNVSTKNRRSLVGIVLANDGSASIGRDRKRTIRETLYRASKGLLSIADLNRLRGQLAYYNSIDSDFVTNLLEKYDIRSPAKIDYPVIDKKTHNHSINKLPTNIDDDLF